MVQQAVCGGTNNHNALAVNTVNYLEREVKIVLTSSQKKL